MRRAAVVCLLLAASCSYSGGRTVPFRPPPEAEPSGPDRGHDLYLRDCAWCHGPEGEGTSRGPDLVSDTNGPAFTDFMLSTGRMPIDFPEETLARQDAIYTPDEIDDIVGYVDTFGPSGPDVPSLDLASGDLGTGLELYQENCAACHSTTAIGGALTTSDSGELTGEVARRSSVVAPSLRLSTPTEVAEAVLVGPGTMPAFGETTFSSEDMNSLVKYVAYLQDPSDRGGADIGKVGPVAEGAVGWIIGIGMLLLFARWVGSGREEEKGGEHG